MGANVRRTSAFQPRQDTRARRLEGDNCERCNKSFSLRTHFTEEEATRRIIQWCVAGMAFTDDEGARQTHMDPAFFNPRTLPAEELRSVDELNALVM